MSETQRVALQPAYLLHHHPYQDTSRIIELLTRDHGRVGLLARGVRSPRSRLGGILLHFRPLLVSWTGRGELPVLSQADALAWREDISGTRLLSGFYMNELLLRLLARHDPHPGVFDLYANTLNRLYENENLEIVLRLFERDLLIELGLGLNLLYEADTGAPINVDAWYRVAPHDSPRRLAAATDGTWDFPGSTLVALAQGRFDDADDLRHCKRLLRQVLSAHLGDKPLKSRDVLRSLI